jgi:molybdate transport system substrate-binding protein
MSGRRLVTALVPVLAAALVLAGAGAALREAGPTVYAAASLTRVFPRIAPGLSYQFGGSNTLALQIQEGAPADVFVSASPKYVVQLRDKGLTAGKPAWFAANDLVLIVPRSNPARIRTPRDVTGPGVRLVIAAVGVPAGDFARKSLAGMHLEAALANVVSNEADVEGVVAKVALGEADAGFVYASDAKAVASKVKVVPLPRAGHYVAVYGAVVVRNAPHPVEARRFVARLLTKRAQAALRAAGFKRPPAR